MLGAGMQLAQENAALACGDVGIAFRGRAHAGKFLRRHDEEKLILGIGQKNEFLGTLSTPTGGDGDAIFFVDGVTKFAGVKGLSRGDAVHGPAGLASTLIHFVPLLTTTAACGQYFFFAFSSPVFPSTFPPPPKTLCPVSPSLFSSASPSVPSASSRRKTTPRSGSASCLMPMARVPSTKPTRQLRKPSPPPLARTASYAKKFDGIWMRTDDFCGAKFLGQRSNFDLSCKTNTTAIITWSRKRIWPKTRA